MSKKTNTVLCAMSGGVDSSVCAWLLLQQGYRVIGVTMKIWSREKKACEKSCCGTDAVEDAKRVAGILDIPFVVLDMEDLFRETVIDDFISEYQSGRTPNPCIVCNTQLKFGYLRQKAAEFGADFVATGHYARIERYNNRYALLRGLDESKDQSYFLYNLNQEQLGQIMFPIAGFTKPEIRKMAAENGLNRVAEKAESQDICFIDRDHRDFLRANIPQDKQLPGPIIDLQGSLLGRHEGLCFYTVGQRKGLGLSLPEPVYVLSMDYEKNTICVGPKEALQRKSFRLRNLVWVSVEEQIKPFRAKVKIRYQHKMAIALISPLAANEADIVFDIPQSGIAAGQSAVFYDEQEQMVLGGGLII